MNTNDLRFIKTEKNLADTYLRLRAKRKPFSLAELCKEAMINKTTFYKHYESLEKFDYEMCKRIMRELYYSTEHINEAFTNTELFVDSISNKMSENKELYDLLFYDDFNKGIRIIEEIHLEIYLKDTYSLEKEIKIRFALAGSAQLLTSNTSKEAKQIIIGLLKKVME